MLVPAEESELISATEQTKYRSGVGKLMHLHRKSRPEIKNAVRDLSRWVSGASEKHVRAMYRVMRYCLGTPERGLVIKPNCRWNGSRDFEFEVTGISDSDYAKCPSTRKSVTGFSVFLCGAVVTTKSKMQPVVALSVTEAETIAAVDCYQEMLFVKRILESMGLKVKKPMKLEIDNKGSVDLLHNWSVGGRTRHMDS